MIDVTQEWALYEKGLDYKRKLNLFATVNKNERFYADRQWEGVASNGLPTPQYNVVARIVDYKVSQVMDNQLKMQFSAEGIDEETQDPEELKLEDVANTLSGYSDTTWERVKMDTMNENGLLDAALSGDMVSYWYWDSSIDAGNGVKGDVNGELIDNVNYFPGNPNNPEVQSQPYIILAFRDLVENIRKEAKANGVNESDLNLISSDTDYQYQAGDNASNELDESGKTIVLLKLWKEKVPAKTETQLDELGQPVKVVTEEEHYTILGKKVCKSVTIRDTWDLGLIRYPVALMNWKKRKNSCHGTSEANGIIPNQVYINKQAALLQLNAMYNAFGKPVFDNTRISSWSNKIGEAIPVNGDITNVATYLNPGVASPDAYKMLDTSIQYTKELQGANETALGDTSVTKTAAGIISLQKAAAVPLATVKRRFYQYIEDVGLIWIDFWTSKYNVPRKLTIKENGVAKVVKFNGADYKSQMFRIKIDVGPSNQWGEVTTLSTLDGMLQGQVINPVQYVERLPKGTIPKQQELVDELTNTSDKQLMYELMARYIDTLPPEQQLALQQMQPDQMEAEVKQMILGQPQGNAQMQPMVQGGM